MAYTLELVFKGRDQVTGMMSGVLSSFGRLGQIAGGIIASRVLWGIADGILRIGSSAIESTAMIQRMQVTLESLLTREYIQQTMEGAAASTFNYATAIEAVQGPAAQLMDTLAKYAILSPFSYEMTIQTFRQAMAFGFGSKEADLFTQATLTLAAGIGADNDMLYRMSYNLAQVRMQNKVTALDVRQLAQAGFDLEAVLRYVGERMGVVVKDHKDFNKAIQSGKISWEDFTKYYAEYADKYFGDASERLARTLFGLKSTFHDVFALSMPAILGPAADVVTKYLNVILNKFIGLRESGALEDIGKKLGEGVQKFLDNIALLKAVFAGGFGLKTQAFSLEKIFNISPAFAKLLVTIRADIVEFITTILGYLPSLDEVGTTFSSMFEGLVEFINTNYNTIKDFIVGLVAGFAAFQVLMASSSMVAGIAAIGTALAAIGWPILLISAAVGVFAAAWNGNWGGMRDTLTAFWYDSVQPALAELWNWLSVNIPVALQALSDFWTTVLLPAIQSVWGWITTSLIPTLMEIWNWLSINIPAALQALSNVWTGTLLPAIQSVWGWLTSVLFPYFRELAAFIGNVFGLAITVLAGLWQNVLLPAIEMVWGSLSNNLSPVLTEVKDTLLNVANSIGAVLQPILQGLVDFIVGVLIPAGLGLLKGAFEGITNAIVAVTEWLGTLNTSLSSVELPEWLQPGSPTPFEMGLIGISTQLGVVGTMAAGLFASLVALGNAFSVYLGAYLENAYKNLKWIYDIGIRLEQFFRQQFIAAIMGLAQAFARVAAAVQLLAQLLSSLRLPPWLKPGSPTPFELGLRGIVSEMSKLNGLTGQFGGISSGLQEPRIAQERTQTTSQAITFNFRDTTLSQGDLVRALNRVAYG